MTKNRQTKYSRNAIARTIFWYLVVIITIALLQYYVPVNCVKEPTIKEVSIRTGNNDKLFLARDCAVKEEVASCNTSKTIEYTSQKSTIRAQVNVPITIDYDKNSTGNFWISRTYDNAESIISWSVPQQTTEKVKEQVEETARIKITNPCTANGVSCEERDEECIEVCLDNLCGKKAYQCRKKECTTDPKGNIWCLRWRTNETND